MPILIDLDTVTVAVCVVSGKNLGNCFSETSYLVYTAGNPDDKEMDKYYPGHSEKRRAQLLALLPACNAGSGLGKFTKVEHTKNTFSAPAYIQIDSGD